MSDPTDAIEAAAAPIWHYSNPEYPIHDGEAWQECRDLARQVLAAATPAGLEAIIRADERAKVAEEIAEALLAVDPIEWALAGQRAGQDAAAIARQHAANPPESYREGRTAPPEGSANHDGHSGAQEAVG